MGPTTISYPPRSRLAHGLGVGSPPSVSFFPRLPSSSLAHGVGVGSPPSLSFFPRLPSSSLPHGISVGSPPSLSFFPRLPSSSLPHGVGIGSPPSLSLSSGDSLARARLCKHAIDPTRPCRWGLPYHTKRTSVNMVMSHPLHTHTPEIL